jgi:hypothetical protein
MASVWICYQVQSLISINQIGLAVWGWLLSGALIAYEIRDRSSSVEIKKSKDFRVQASEMDDLKGTLTAIAGMVVGVLIALPPLAADVKWLGALKSQNLDTIMSALKPSYFNPTDSARLVVAVTGLQSNNLNKEALEIARQGVTYNPDFTDAWKMLYYIPIATEAEKKLAKENLTRLDPLNPKWKELP